MGQEGSKRFLSFSPVITEVFKKEGDASRGRKEFVGDDRAGTENVGRLGSGFLMEKL